MIESRAVDCTCETQRLALAGSLLVYAVGLEGEVHVTLNMAWQGQWSSYRTNSQGGQP